jgi:hypothetical protein
MIEVSMCAPMLETLLELIDYSLVTRRVEWLGIFWFNCLALHESGLGLGSTRVPYFITIVTRYANYLWFPDSIENRDLG